jgi:hypothetical protein
MKRLIVRLLLLSILATAGVLLWRHFFPPPDIAIRKQLAALAKAASFAGKEAPMTSLYNATKLVAFCTPDVELHLDVPGTVHQSFQGREELQNTIAGARAMLTSLQVQFVDVVVQVGADKRSAVVNLTLRCGVSGEPDGIVQEMKVFLKKISSDWLISRAETVKTLQ